MTWNFFQTDTLCIVNGTTRPSMLLISISFEGHHWWSHREPEQRDGPMAM
ncbi:hypothetical protein HanRHA438_Chr13g0596821 [Helianthus annuus]|uniref:Uncharacterized protein n=1 Tax=Helianthus annuus TaxID=4232 RepID=A0A9K3EHC7_HELAN|nr:hypothetical protein HanXRQr2_Chr13g0586141 [Helianthus annuus]KAJ0476722.1 hypothetical protein HanHA300_Chr13g0480481 [Helianthus annuus]KAJ0481030.1 hypothetical protein HanIR_Chr13g0638171 [Helianthus annuus]KAJ0497548.1 hypothetical protein HanHA89_Chr13g0512561 [Helianthus annuus]KAJ0671054.1 hypothetical protein HanOQP8_Chr13g0481401 [Helianthus annuus]